MSLSFNYDVVRTLKYNIRNAGQKKRKAGMKATERVAKKLLKLSQKLVPVDTGNLKESGRVEKSDQGILSYSVVYSATVRDRHENYGKPKSLANVADPDFNYAYAIHEDVPRVYNHPNGGQSKYLEQPYRENKDKFLAEIGNAIRRAK